jgi:hypothetical protein
VPGAAPGTEDRRRHDASYIDTLAIANAAALLYTLTRLLTPASYRRARVLAAKVGVPAEEIDAHFGREPEPTGDWQPRREW